MGIETYITDPKNHDNASVIPIYNGYNGLIVATEPLRKFENQGKIFFNPIYGIDMNIGTTIAYTENVYDGGDNTYWTASAITGAKWTLSSTDQQHNGAFSLKYDNGNINDTLEFTKGSNLDLTNYGTLSFWIYVDLNWTAGDSIEIYGWDTTGGTQVGSRVNIENHFAWNVFKTWHRVNISLDDMNISGATIDAIRIEIAAKDVQSPTIYIDEIQITGSDEEAGSGEFTIEPDAGTWFYVDNIRFVLADDISGRVPIDTVPDPDEYPTMKGLSYDKLLGLDSLDNGIVYQRLRYGDIQTTFTVRQLSDILSTPKVSYQTISDGTNTMLTIDMPFTAPVILRAEEQDKLKIIISDNLSGLLLFRVFVGGWKEIRTD